mmetsp:Transcript_55570/g.148218  ORF Transcript_55570/g.148218 Transcript_55570/m.148218 type:complete len:206 (-) Transcript_55570:205-822(-)
MTSAETINCVRPPSFVNSSASAVRTLILQRKSLSTFGKTKVWSRHLTCARLNQADVAPRIFAVRPSSARIFLNMTSSLNTLSKALTEFTTSALHACSRPSAADSSLSRNDNSGPASRRRQHLRSAFSRSYLASKMLMGSSVDCMRVTASFDSPAMSRARFTWSSSEAKSGETWSSFTFVGLSCLSALIARICFGITSESRALTIP